MISKRKSILILGNYPPPYGGVPRHIENLAPYLVEKGWDVHILPVGRSGVEKKNGITIYKYHRIKKIFIFLKSLLTLKMKSDLRLRTVLLDSPMRWLSYMLKASMGRQIIKKNRINIISAYNLLSNVPAGAILSEEYNIPLVVNNLGEIYEAKDYFKKHIDMLKYICSIGAKFLSLTSHCAESYKILGLSPEVEIVNYGIDTNRFSPNNDGSIIRQRLGISNKDKLVLFVGRMIREMGLHTVLEVAPQLLLKSDKVKFLIIGGKGDLYESAIQLSRRYKKHVFVFSNVPLEDLPLYYSASNILVAPTKGDRACGSLAAAEAMATGKPVIASKVGGIPEIVIDGETGLLIPPEDPLALEKAILDLLKDESLIKKMEVRGRIQAKTYLDKDKTNLKMEKIYSEIVGI